MARLWTSGFELRSATGGVEVDTVTGTAPTISTTTARTAGGAAIRFNPAAATSFVTHRFAANAVRSQFARIAFRFASFPAADVDIFQWYDGTNGFPSVRFFAATSKLQCRDGAAGLIGSASATLSLNTWYVLQVAYNDTTGDTVNAYLDGTQFCTNGAGGDVGGLGQVRFGLITASTADLFMDDIAVNDSTGTADTGLPDRDARVAILNVNAAGDNNLWPTATGGTAGTANNFTRVSDLPPDDATTHNGLAATGTTQIDDFNVTDSSTAGIASGDAVAHVGVGIRVGSTATTTTSLVARLKGQSGGTTTESASISAAISGWRTGGVVAAGNPQPSANILAYVNPQGSVAWTAPALDSIQVGYRANVSQTSVRRVTKVWALVEYVPNPSTPATVTPITLVGLVAITGTAQAGAAAAPGTITGTTTISGTVQLSITAAPATIAGGTTISGTAQTGSTAVPATISPVKVVITGTVLTGSTALPATIAGTTTISGTAQAGAVSAPATIAPTKVAISGTAQTGSLVAPATIAPVKVVISGTAETSSASTVPASTIAPPKVAVSGTAVTGSTAAPATISPPPVTISGVAQSSRTAAVAAITGVTTISGTAQAGAVAALATITGSAVISGTAQGGAAPAPASILGAVLLSGTAVTGSTATPGTIAPAAVIISGSAATASGVNVAAATITGQAAITGAGSAGHVAPAATILGTAAISGTAAVGSTARPATIFGDVAIGPHTATSSSGAIPAATTISGAAAITGTGRASSTGTPATILGAAGFPAVGIVTAIGVATINALAAISGTAVVGQPQPAPGTITGQTTIGPHLVFRTGVVAAATILGAVAMASARVTAGEVIPGNPVVLGDPVVAHVTSGLPLGVVTGTEIPASVGGSTITAGVS